jgi:hypothetical protein
MLFLSGTVFSRDNENFVNKISVHEIGFSLCGGVSIAMKPDFGSGTSFVYLYRFHPNWSAGADLGLSFSTIRFVSDAIETTQWETYMFDTLTTIGKNSRLEHLTERQRMLNLSLGITVCYNTLWYGNRQYYVEFGGKLSGTVWNTYYANANRLVTSGDFPEFMQYLENIPTHSFIEITDPNKLNYKGKSVFSRPHFFITLEGGIRHIIAKNTYFHIGLFIDCGVTNSTKNNSAPLIDYNPDILLNTAALPEFKYAGVFQTDIIKKSRTFTVFTGIKLRFTFSLP